MTYQDTVGPVLGWFGLSKANANEFTAPARSMSAIAAASGRSSTGGIGSDFAARAGGGIARAGDHMASQIQSAGSSTASALEQAAAIRGAAAKIGAFVASSNPTAGDAAGGSIGQAARGGLTDGP